MPPLEMKIKKGSRHSKITGDFAEHLVLYWLSKYGFECARVDHTGIDLIANNPYTREVMGISVKSRCRNLGKEKTSLRIPRSDLEKARFSCDAFHCVPYFAVVFDIKNEILVYILTLERMMRLFPGKGANISWAMRKKNREVYEKDPEIKFFRFETSTLSWWGSLATKSKKDSSDIREPEEGEPFDEDIVRTGHNKQKEPDPIFAGFEKALFDTEEPLPDVT